jgi:hypothetical protein
MTNSPKETVAAEFIRISGQSGEPPVVVSVKLAGVVCQIRAPFPEWKHAFEDGSGVDAIRRARTGRLRRFATQDSPRIVARVREYPPAHELARQAWQSLPEVPPGCKLKVFWHGGGAYIVHERCLSRWDPVLDTIEILVRDANAIGDAEIAIRCPLLLFITERGGLAVHSCGLVHDGRAVIFFGVSGSGKTTFADMSHAQAILSDEAVIVDRRGPQWIAYGTPFAGTLESGENLAAPLVALVRLARGERNRVVRMPPGRALAELLKTVFLLDDSRATSRRALENAMTLADDVPVYELYSSPGPRVWPFVREELADLWR